MRAALVLQRTSTSTSLLLQKGRKLSSFDKDLSASQKKINENQKYHCVSPAQASLLVMSEIASALHEVRIRSVKGSRCIPVLPS